MKKTILEAFSYTCVSFTTVSVLMALAGYAGIQRDLFSAETLQLLLVCVVLSATQAVCNAIPAIDNRHILRALINVAELFLLGGGLFNWFGWQGGWSLRAFASLGTGALVSFLAYGAVWLYADIKIRRDAKEINEVLQQRRQTPEE